MGKKRKQVTRAVVDTNAFVSSILLKGVSNQLVDCWQKEKFVYVISKPILEEYIKVLSYPKFGLDEIQIKEIIEEELLPYVEVIESKSSFAVIIDDPFDNEFLSAAVDGKASFIVSSDHHLLNLGEFKGIRIVKTTEFISLI